MILLSLATVRADIADYLSALLEVYYLLLIAYIVTSFIFGLGVRVPYSRWSNMLLGFLRDVAEPYLRIFRRMLPPFGAFDLSPILALVALFLVGNLIISAVRG